MTLNPYEPPAARDAELSHESATQAATQPRTWQQRAILGASEGAVLGLMVAVARAGIQLLRKGMPNDLGMHLPGIAAYFLAFIAVFAYIFAVGRAIADAVGGALCGALLGALVGAVGGTFLDNALLGRAASAMLGTALGTACGAPLGALLHRYTVSRFSTDDDTPARPDSHQ